MNTTRLLLLGLALSTVGASVAEAQFDLATPTYHEVHLLVHDGQHDATQSTLWVRIYSETQNAWSTWKPVEGPFATSSATPVMFQTAPSFTDISRVQVWEGANDGARVTVRMRSSNGVTYQSARGRWIKGGSVTFDVAPVQAKVVCEYTPLVCSCDVGPECFGLWLSGVCDQDSWECFDYGEDLGGGQYCICTQ